MWFQPVTWEDSSIGYLFWSPNGTIGGHLNHIPKFHDSVKCNFSPL